jgi:flagellar biosynthesis/type III secretory pathway M-ring protein FliF/YscJ
MDDIGNIGYILFFVFILIVNAIASANKRKQKQRQQQERERQRQNQPEAESGERTKSLEEVMRELFGDTRPSRKPEPPPEAQALPEAQEFVTDEDAQAVKQVEERQRRYANPLQEVMEATMNDPKRIAQRKADQEQLARIFSQAESHRDPSRRYVIDPRQAVIHSEILLKPRWREY